MDTRGLGQRLARAREDAGMTQQELGRMVGLDRTAITRLEAGDRKLSVPELVEIAQTLGRPLAHFVSQPVPAVVSRRSDVALGHGTSSALDAQLDDFATDVRTLMEMRLLRPVQRPDDARIPQDHQAAEEMASSVRRGLDLGAEAIGDLGRVCERLGLLVYSAPLGHGGPDGACVEVDEGSASLGASVINGEAPLGRRRMTLAHELGHWLSGDAYDSRASGDAKRMINSFAIYFLAPRIGVVEVWAHHSEWSTRDRALAVGAAFRLSWSAVIGQLSNIQLIDQDGYRRLRDDEPRYGDYVRLGLSWTDELGSPYLSPGFAAVCVNGYASGRLTSDRALQLLRGTLTVDGLPRRDPPSVEDLRRSFAGHGGR